MMIRLKRLRGMLSMLLVLTFAIASHNASAQDVFHSVSGVVKSIDKGTKTVVVKAADGTEHTIKYTDKTVVKGAKDSGSGVEKGSVDTYMGAKVGSKVTVKYTEKGTEKTAVGVEDASKATANAVSK